VTLCREFDEGVSVDTVAPQKGEENLSRRYLKGFAGGTAHMFACSAQHYAWLAHRYGISHVTIDLLSLKIEPHEFDIERNRILAGHCRASLLRNLERLAQPAAVNSAFLTANFGVDDYREDDRCPSVGESSFTVVLTDDRGKEWRGVVTERRVLAQG